MSINLLHITYSCFLHYLVRDQRLTRAGLTLKSCIIEVVPFK
ncbi:hypothetical protein Pse7367_1868 [Thalassoporum mexicanum PCC 7367]|nr:hypothetical protein Pse7367_1868 [Pseudanabaena sp. PCC 7367]